MLEPQCGRWFGPTSSVMSYPTAVGFKFVKGGGKGLLRKWQEEGGLSQGGSEVEYDSTKP